MGRPWLSGVAMLTLNSLLARCSLRQASEVLAQNLLILWFFVYISLADSPVRSVGLKDPHRRKKMYLGAPGVFVYTLFIHCDLLVV